MKTKCNLTIIIVMLISGLVYAYDPLMDPLTDTHIKLYTALRDEKWTVGTFLNMRLGRDLSLQVDSENWIQEFLTNRAAFSPNQINYGLGLKFRNFGWFHSCIHFIDKLPFYEGDPAANGYQKNRFYVDF